MYYETKKECNPRQGYEGKQSVRYTMNTIINVTKRDEEYGNKSDNTILYWMEQTKQKRMPRTDRNARDIAKMALQFQ